MSSAFPKPSSRDEAVSLLAPALGEEKARETVDAAAAVLQLSSGEWAPAQLRALFAHVSMESGLVGITARVVSRRLRMSTGGSVTSALSTQSAPASGPRPLQPNRKPVDAIADLLAQALGVEKARREVDKAARAAGLGDLVDFNESLKLLELMAREPGLVGIAAQFAKTRLHLLSW